MGSVDNVAAGSVAEVEEEEEEGDRGDRAAEETDRSGNGFCLFNLVTLFSFAEEIICSLSFLLITTSRHLISKLSTVAILQKFLVPCTKVQTVY